MRLPDPYEHLRHSIDFQRSCGNTIGKILMVPGATPISPSEQDIYEASAVMPPDIAGARDGIVARRTAAPAWRRS